MTKPTKPNCYKCRWRGTLLGDAHSKCCHPYNNAFSENPELKMFAIFASVGRTDLPAIADKRLKIKANPIGIRNGWFHYPFNFDPVWLERCEGFEKAEKDDPRVVNNCEKPIFCKDCESKFDCFTKRGKEEEDK